MSADGARIVAATCDPYQASGLVFVSADAGATWAPASPPPAPGGWAMASSADGATLVGVSSYRDGGGAIPCFAPVVAMACISTNYGQAWTLSAFTNVNCPFSFVASADGTTLAFAVDAGLIYTLQGLAKPALTCTPSRDHVLISWMVPSRRLALQESADVERGGWSNVPETPILNDTNLRYEVRIPLGHAAAFYRLALP